MTRWKMSLISLVCALLAGCGTTTPLKTAQRATVHLTIKWPKATRAVRTRPTRASRSRAMRGVRPRTTRDIDPTADTIILTVSSAGAVVDTETITKPADGSASQVMVSAPVQKTRIDAVAYNSADPNTILDQGSAPSDGGSYLSLAPGNSNTVALTLAPPVSSIDTVSSLGFDTTNNSISALVYPLVTTPGNPTGMPQFATIDPVTGIVTPKGNGYSGGDLGGYTYNYTRHMLYITDENCLYTYDIQTGNQTQKVILSLQIPITYLDYLGFDTTNNTILAVVVPDNGVNNPQFSTVDPTTEIVTPKGSGYFSDSPGGYTYDYTRHLLYISAGGYLYTYDTQTGNQTQKIILSPQNSISYLGFDTTNNTILAVAYPYPGNPLNSPQFAVVDPTTGVVTPKGSAYFFDDSGSYTYDYTRHLLYISDGTHLYTYDAQTGNQTRTVALSL